MSVWALCFWSSAVLIAYTYVFYPAILVLLKRIRPRTRSPTTLSDLPRVTVIVPAFNEEAIIGDKIANLEATAYPAGRLSVLVGSDGSTDATNQVLGRRCSGHVRSILFEHRRGKAAVLNDLVALADGDVIVFSDANASYTPDTIRRLVAQFADPTVGAVCGELILKADNDTAGGHGEGLYWRYENWLKRLESDIATTLGAVGPVYAIRRRLFRPLPIDDAVVDDFLIPLAVIEQGYRVHYEPTALAYERPANSVAGEFRRKTRIGASNFQGIPTFRRVLNPAYGFASFALWSHKVVRWFVPVLLMTLLLSSAVLAASSPFFVAVAAAQGLFFAAAAAGLLLEMTGRRPGVLGLPYYFVGTNAALFVGLMRCLFGRQRATWDVVR